MAVRSRLGSGCGIPRGRGARTAAALVVAACGGEPAADVAPAADAAPAPADSTWVTVAEVFETPRDTLDNIDSPAVWHGPEGQHWLLATAKETDVIVVSDATTGVVLQRVGGGGTDPGLMDRPNGIAVVDDLVFLVERDNRRVQVFTLPDFGSLGTFGETDLRRSYGVAIIPEEGAYRTYITDNYEFEEDVIPADSLLGERIREYRVEIEDGVVAARLVNTFGDVTGEGVLRVVESIAVDPEGDRLLIAEEKEGASMIKVYALDGRFSGGIIDQQWFPYQAEGIVLYTCADGAGYWITTDQGEMENTFHVFDRRTLEPRGSFRGRTVLNTDGVALTQVGFGPFPEGAFYAVHNDGNVAAFRWGDIANALSLRSDCTTGGR